MRISGRSERVNTPTEHKGLDVSFCNAMLGSPKKPSLKPSLHDVSEKSRRKGHCQRSRVAKREKVAHTYKVETSTHGDKSRLSADPALQYSSLFETRYSEGRARVASCPRCSPERRHNYQGKRLRVATEQIYRYNLAARTFQRL